jgi:DNA ligase-associated metallophosphoesterase
VHRWGKAEADRARLDITFAGLCVTLDASGALWLAHGRTLIVSDLHLEKGSFYAARGVPVPVCDTRETLARLSAAISAYRPDRVICLGDSFHDAGAGARMAEDDLCAVHAMARSVGDWLWIAGNHDPHPQADLPGRFAPQAQVAGVYLRHEPASDPAGCQIIGHYHPKAKLRLRGQKLSGRCFAVGADVLVMPSFGAFAGGLEVRDAPPWPSLLGEAPNLYLLFRNQVWPLRN